MIHTIATIFNNVLYYPLLNVLFLFYYYLPGKDFGVAVILLVVLINFLFLPLRAKAIKSQKEFSELQPKIKEIQEKYKNDKEKQAKELMNFYKERKINPLSAFVPLIIQIPIIFALYQVALKALKPETMANLYSFVPRPDQVNPMFLGLIDLSQPNIILAVLAAITQFFQFKTMPQQKVKSNKPDITQMMMKQQAFIFPLLILFMGLKLPSVLTLYWAVMNIFMIVQQYLMLKKQKT